MKMLPLYIAKTTSNAERKLFKSIGSTAGMAGWTCLHSLGVSNHIYKREGEIDFLLIGIEGIFVIEAKGGRVKRENGIWKFTDRYGHITEKHESPFTQAQSAMYSLRAELVHRFGSEVNQYLFGYGVAFPDIPFDTESPEWDNRSIYTIADTEKPFTEYMQRLMDSWKSKQRSRKPLTAQNVKEIVQFLRGDFEAVMPVTARMEESEAELVKLTDEQIASLDSMAANPRIVFQGAAGTGKTLLAVEQARRNAADGKNTLMLCYNKYLAAYLKEAVSSEKLDDLITVKTVHGFFHDTITGTELANELERVRKAASPAELYNKHYPELFLKAWNGREVYDSLIIDEAQDVLTGAYIEPFSTLLKGGIDTGNWYMFLDPENQKDMFSRLDQAVLAQIQQYAATFTLSINCRNTRPIALQTEILSGIHTAKVKKVEGMPVQFIWYENDAEQGVKVSEAINKLLREGVKGDDIVILSPLRYSVSVAGTGKLRLDIPLHHLEVEDIALQPGGRIAYTSIQSFKGLERQVVVVTDLTDLDKDWNRIVNYVGLTRARNALIVAAKKELKTEYKQRLKSLAEAS